MLKVKKFKILQHISAYFGYHQLMFVPHDGQSRQKYFARFLKFLAFNF
jgi:hypothetical protein